MTVRTLIEQLQAIVARNSAIAQYEVTTEGCDCNGDVEKIETFHGFESGGSHVFLRRSQ